MQFGLELLCEKHRYNADKEKRKKQFNYCCAYCGNKPKHLTIDHIVPRAKGGTNNIDNLIPACSSCNESKGNKELEDWYNRRNPIWDSERQKKILEVISQEQPSSSHNKLELPWHQSSLLLFHQQPH